MIIIDRLLPARISTDAAKEYSIPSVCSIVNVFLFIVLTRV